jgi:putative phage-type endonuclease
MNYQSLLDRCPHISTVGMSNDAWLDKRREAVGGSDAGAIMGMSGYGSPLTVYLQKKNLDPTIKTSKAARRGKILEQYIRAETIKDFPGLDIETVPLMLFDPDYLFMAANIDGVILAEEPVEIRGETIQGLGGHEIKSAATDYGWGDDEIPDTYYVQVQHYMRVTGLPWFVVSVYVLDGELLYHYVIRRNEDFITRLIVAERDFWENYVEKDIMPAPLGIENEDDMITGMFDGAQGTVILNDEEIALCKQHSDLNDQIKALEKQKYAVDIEFKAKLTARVKPDKERKLSASGGSFSVSWSFFKKHGVDSDALKRDGIYDQYCKITDSDRMVITDKSKKKKGA